MTTRTDFHTDTSNQFLIKARAYLAEGDLLQASEKGWGATAQMVKAIAEERGWRHRSHGDLFRAIDRLTTETGDQQLPILFGSANALHQNFYEGLMSTDFVERSLNGVDELVERLRDCLE